MRVLRMLGCAALLAVAGCGGDDGPPATGGTDGGGGMDAAVAPRDAGGGGGDAGCVHTGPPLIDPAVLPVCELCANARCVPAGFVPAEARDMLGDCEDGTKCVPELFIETNGDFLLESCRSLGDAEGRCVTLCVPAAAAQAERLPQATCAEDERCVPCFDPTTGEETGACGLSCDPGPTEPPVTFARCCNDLGACVSTELVPEDQRALLPMDSCVEGQLCAPDDLTDPTFVPESCRSIGEVEGRCLPSCLPDIAAQADRLPQATCPEHHLCAPCYDPISGEDSGACRLNGDMPAEEPAAFERCCSDLGACVPTSAIPADGAALLGTDTCTEADVLCVPDELADSTFVPPACRSVGDAEGRCLPGCLPAVAARAGTLPRDTCAATHLCVPCYDPIDGGDTGACTLNGDTPADPPLTFPGCCTYMGTDRARCVPETLVPPADRGSLPQDTCSTGELCVVDALLADPTYSFPTCTTTGLIGGGNPGACVPDCMVTGWESWLLSRSSCAAGELCAPCNNPLTGASTGACR